VGGYGTTIILATTNGGATWVSQVSGLTNGLESVHFPLNATTGYAVGQNGTILKTTDGGIGVENGRDQGSGIRNQAYRVTPNPFSSFAILPGHSTERFALYDVSGHRVGIYKGDRIGEGLAPGVYFLRSADGSSKPLRIVKVR
jgi:hypothetical protein